MEWGIETGGASRTIVVGGVALNGAWGFTLCTVCRWMILLGDAPQGCHLKFTSVGTSLVVGIVIDQTCLPSGTSQFAEGIKGRCGPRLPCL